MTRWFSHAWQPLRFRTKREIQTFERLLGLTEMQEVLHICSRGMQADLWGFPRVPVSLNCREYILVSGFLFRSLPWRSMRRHYFWIRWMAHHQVQQMEITPKKTFFKRNIHNYKHGWLVINYTLIVASFQSVLVRIDDCSAICLRSCHSLSLVLRRYL